MKLKHAFAIVLLYVAVCGATILLVETRKAAPSADPFSAPYSVTILDDNCVRLASKSDTITLILENSATFNDEYVVFIKK